jgi:hypothetical protein
MLANPVALFIELKDTLGLSTEQVAQVQEISEGLQGKLNKRREELGKRFDNQQPQQQAGLFQELQPEIEASRREVMDALGAVRLILTAEQWGRVPERIREPYQAARGQRRRG